MNKTWIFLLQNVVQKCDKLDLNKIEKIRAYGKAPWIPPRKISISQYKLEAIQQA